MRFRDGPAAVTGDKGRIKPLHHIMREGAVRRMIRKSEDLSEEKSVRPAVNAEQLSIARLHGQEGSGEVYSWIKKGIPGSVLYRSGFFFCPHARAIYDPRQRTNTLFPELYH